MSHFVSIVRFRVKQGHQEEIIRRLSEFERPAGATDHVIVQTGEHTLCTYVMWNREEDLVQARPQMIAFLDTVRDQLEELSPELGVTDPASGPVIFRDQA